MTMTMMMMRGRTVPLRPLSSPYLVFKRADQVLSSLSVHIYHRRCGAKDTQFTKWVRRRSLHPIRQVTRSNNEIRRAPQEEAKLTPPTFPARANFQITIPRNWKVTKVVSLISQSGGGGEKVELLCNDHSGNDALTAFPLCSSSVLVRLTPGRRNPPNWL